MRPARLPPVTASARRPMAASRCRSPRRSRGACPGRPGARDQACPGRRGRWRHTPPAPARSAGRSVAFGSAMRSCRTGTASVAEDADRDHAATRSGRPCDHASQSRPDGRPCRRFWPEAAPARGSDRDRPGRRASPARPGGPSPNRPRRSRPRPSFRAPIEVNTVEPVSSRPDKRDQDGQAGDDDRAADGRRRDLERGRRIAARARVRRGRGERRTASSRRRPRARSTGSRRRSRWRPARSGTRDPAAPSAATTEVTPSSSGTEAATSAPNASTRIEQRDREREQLRVAPGRFREATLNALAKVPSPASWSVTCGCPAATWRTAAGRRRRDHRRCQGRRGA